MPRISVGEAPTPRAPMLRRNARQRREFLYQKGVEAKERATHERKRKVREAIEEGKPLPTELLGEADALRAQIALDDAAHGGAPSEGIDSEYFNAGVSDPKVLVTTAHDPSSKLTQFLKEVRQQQQRRQHVTNSYLGA